MRLGDSRSSSVTRHTATQINICNNWHLGALLAGLSNDGASCSFSPCYYNFYLLLWSPKHHGSVSAVSLSSARKKPTTFCSFTFFPSTTPSYKIFSWIKNGQCQSRSFCETASYCVSRMTVWMCENQNKRKEYGINVKQVSWVVPMFDGFFWKLIISTFIMSEIYNLHLFITNYKPWRAISLPCLSTAPLSLAFCLFYSVGYALL